MLCPRILCRPLALPSLQSIAVNRARAALIGIGSKKIVLGTYGSAESHKRFGELIGGDKVPKPTATTDPTVAVLLVGYLEFAQAYYPTRNKRRTSEYHDLLPVMRHVRA